MRREPSKMRREPSNSHANFIEVLERVIDKGIVIDAWMRVSVVGVSLLTVTVEARVLVASIETYLNHARAPLGTGRRL